VTREQAQLLRLLLICVAWALGQTITVGLSIAFAGIVVPAALAIGVYVLTDDLGRQRPGGGDGRYWRGRRIDDDNRRGGGRWN
jgi:hypothetical protein